MEFFRQLAASQLPDENEEGFINTRVINLASDFQPNSFVIIEQLIPTKSNSEISDVKTDEPRITVTFRYNVSQKVKLVMLKRMNRESLSPLDTTLVKTEKP